MDEIKQMAKTVAQCIKGDTKKTHGYDTAATVKRIDGGTAYVSIPAGVPETPVKKTIDAKVGDTVQVHVENGTAWLVGNQTAPPTDDAEALKAKKVANTALDDATRARQAADSAKAAAETAEAYAQEAKQTTDEINAYAETAGKTVTQILNDGETAGVAAQEAKQSAENASEYASRALGNLSTVQSVSETLTWITQHGTMTLTSDQHLDPTHVYFVVDAQGDYVVGGTHYSIVAEPDEDDLSTYYELTIDESLNNYVGTHLALDGEGLWLLPATSGTNKVLIATGAGSTYTTAGTYLIDGSGNVLASFRIDGVQIGETAGTHFVLGSDGQTIYAEDGSTIIAHLGYGDTKDTNGNKTTAPYYVIGEPIQGEQWYDIGQYSYREGYVNRASKFCAHAEGNACVADGNSAHAEGQLATASGIASHAESYFAEASGNYSHAQNCRTVASHDSQTAIGKYNDNKSANAFEIGNGTSTNARSNAFEVTWTGDTKAYGDIEDGSGNILSDKADTTAIPTATSDLTNDSGFIASDSSGNTTITGKATLGAINGDSLFAYTSISVTTSSIAANASGEATSSASTLANHYPLAITDVNISTGVASLRRFYFSTQQTGRAVVKIGVQNDGTSAKTISATAKILWVKTSV